MASKRRSLQTAHDFPRLIARFSSLEGGQYGTIELLAVTPAKLELQLGDEFVQFSHAQARDVRDAFDRFLALERHPPKKIVEEVVEVVERTRGRRGAEKVVVVEELRRKRAPKARRARTHAATP